MKKSRQDIGCQQVLLHPTPELRAVLEYVCGQANKIYNCSVYYARQVFFKEKRYVNRGELNRVMKWNPQFTSMYVSASQQVCNGVAEAIQSFKELAKAYRCGKLAEIPRLPGYRTQGMFTVSYPKRWIKLEGNQIRLPLGRTVNAWFGLDSFYLDWPSNLSWDKLKELRILPRNGCFYAEFVYAVYSVTAFKPAARSASNRSKALGIDHGIDNWLTCVSNVGTSFIVDGKHLKSLNQYYNKRVSTLKENRPQGFWSNRLAAITEKRNRQMRDAVNKVARLVIHYCLEHQIGTVVFGWNQGQKKNASMGKKENQKFVQVPTAKLKDRIAQLCKQYRIEFVETEEANTSAASFLDGDTLPKHGEKPEGWRPSGRRVKRGLYRTASNQYINADCNGAANILAKVAATIGLDLSGASRGALTTPLRVRFWTLKNLPALAG